MKNTPYTYSIICISSKIEDCGGGRTAVYLEVEQVYSEVEKVYSQKYSDGERRTAVDDFEECLNKI